MENIICSIFYKYYDISFYHYIDLKSILNLALVNKRFNKIFKNYRIYDIYIKNMYPYSKQIINVFGINSITGLQIICLNDEELINHWKKIKKEFKCNNLSIDFDHINNQNDEVLLKFCIKLKYIGFILLLDRLLFCAGYEDEYIDKFIKIYEIFINYKKNIKSKKINIEDNIKNIIRDNSNKILEKNISNLHNHTRLLYTYYCIFKLKWYDVYNIIKKLIHKTTFVFMYLKYYDNFLYYENLLIKIIISHQKNDIILYKIGVIFINKLQYDNALRVFNMCLNIVSHHNYDITSKLFIYKNISFCYLKKNNYEKYLHYLQEANNVVIPNLTSLNIKYYYYDINVELFSYYYNNNDYDNAIIYILNIMDKDILFNDDNIFYFMEVCLKLNKYDVYCKLLQMLYNSMIKKLNE